MAADTAHPGSPSCRQLPNRHSRANSSISANVSRIPASTFHNANSRSPGVSISNAPPGKRNKCRAVVVCRPLLSASRVGLVACFSSANNRFSSVDLPTPDEPSNTIVFPGQRSASSASIPFPVRALSASTGTPIAARSVSATCAATSTHSSALFSTTNGATPESQHCARYRSSRRGLKSISSAATKNAVSTFAAITCCSTRLPGALRENTPRRGNTQCNMDRSSPTASAATQSPAAGHSTSRFPSAMLLNFPDGSAQLSPNSPASLHNPRCCETTRAGFAPPQSLSPNRSFHIASKYPFQPKSSKRTRAPSCRKAAFDTASARTQCGSAIGGDQNKRTPTQSQTQEFNSMNGEGVLLA